MGTRTSCDVCDEETSREKHYVVEVTRGLRTDEERELLIERDLCQTCYERLRSIWRAWKPEER